MRFLKPDETWSPHWDQAHAKNPDDYENARIVVFAPDEQDLHELTLCCIRTLDHNGAWDFHTEHLAAECKNIVTFKYNGTITAVTAGSGIRSRCVHTMKWEFLPHTDGAGRRKGKA